MSIISYYISCLGDRCEEQGQIIPRHDQPHTGRARQEAGRIKADHHLHRERVVGPISAIGHEDGETVQGPGGGTVLIGLTLDQVATIEDGTVGHRHRAIPVLFVEQTVQGLDGLVISHVVRPRSVGGGEEPTYHSFAVEFLVMMEFGI